MLVEPPRPRAVRDSRYAAWLAVATVCLGAFMGQLDASIVTLTFPALQNEFGDPLAAVQWVSLAYLLTLVGLVVAAGRLADSAGRKLVYLYGFVIFTLASAACGLAPGLAWLVGFRVVQAVGAAMLQANSVALVITSVPRARMRSALGVQAAAQALGLALGPTVGGLLVASAGWRWVFWVNVPVGVVALLAGRYLLPRTRTRDHSRRFDGVGLVLLAVSTTAVLLALSGVAGLAMPSRASAGLAILSLLAAIAFVVWQRRAANPLVPLAILRPAAVSRGLVGALFAYLVLFGPLTLFPQVLGQARGAAAGVGIMLTALPAGFALAALTAERLLPSAWSARRRSLSGAGLFVIAAAALAVAPTARAWVAPWLGVMGLGLGVFIPANNAMIMAAIPARVSAVGGGLLNMGRGLGTALGVALISVCLHAAGPARLFTSGPRLALLSIAVLGLAAGATSLGHGASSSGQRHPT